MGIQALVDQHKYIRDRLLGLLESIEKSGHGDEAIYWKLPFGENGRAHICWQVLHCAVTLEKYYHIRLLNTPVSDPGIVEKFGSGSKPDTSLKYSFEEIRNILEKTLTKYFSYFENLGPDKFDSKPFEDSDRTHKEILMLLNWHEAEHTGQCQIIWNSFKAEKNL